MSCLLPPSCHARACGTVKLVQISCRNLPLHLRLTIKRAPRAARAGPPGQSCLVPLFPPLIFSIFHSGVACDLHGGLQGCVAVNGWAPLRSKVEHARLAQSLGLPRTAPACSAGRAVSCAWRRQSRRRASGASEVPPQTRRHGGALGGLSGVSQRRCLACHRCHRATTPNRPPIRDTAAPTWAERQTARRQLVCASSSAWLSVGPPVSECSAQSSLVARPQLPACPYDAAVCSFERVFVSVCASLRAGLSVTGVT